MTLLIHIALAFSSIIFAAAVYAKPTLTKFRVSYGLIASTLASGVVLMAQSPSHAAEATVSGVTYLAIVTIATIAARRKATVTE